MSMSSTEGSDENGYRFDTTRSIGLDSVGRQVVEVPGLRPVGQDAAVDLGVQRLDTAAEHFGRPRHLGHLEVCDPSLGQLGRRVAAGDELPAEVREAPGQLDQALLVVDGQQGSHDVISSTAPSLFSGSG